MPELDTREAAGGSKLPMKVLVVEDNPISRKLTRVALEADGFAVTEAQDGHSAIDCVTRDIPDLILQDILLPDISGFDLVGRLHRLPGAGPGASEPHRRGPASPRGDESRPRSLAGPDGQPPVSTRDANR